MFCGHIQVGVRPFINPIRVEERIFIRLYANQFIIHQLRGFGGAEVAYTRVVGGNDWFALRHRFSQTETESFGTMEGNETVAHAVQSQKLVLGHSVVDDSDALVTADPLYCAGPVGFVCLGSQVLQVTCLDNKSCRLPSSRECLLKRSNGS